MAERAAQHHAETRRVGRQPRLGLTLHIERQLLAKEEVLRPEGCFRSAPQDQESEGVLSKCKEQGEEAIDGQLSSRGTGGCHGLRLASNPSSGGFSGQNIGGTEYLGSTTPSEPAPFNQAPRPTRRIASVRGPVCGLKCLACFRSGMSHTPKDQATHGRRD